MENVARVSRTTVFAAIFFAALMLGMPSFVSNNGHGVGAVGTAAAANGSRTFIVGQADFTASVTTLSPFLYTSAAEMMTIWPCYSTLIMYDTNGVDRIGDLALSWSFSPDGLTWTFNLANNAYFIDPLAPLAKTHQVTADDVIYTYWQVQNYTNTLHSYFPGVIERMWADTPYVLNIKLSTPYAPFVGALTSIPIIPKYYWLPHEAHSGDATKWTGALPIGSGPWYYTLPGLPSTGEVVLQRNPQWFQEANRGWQLHVDTLKYKTETDDGTAWQELKLGLIDVMMGVPPPVYTETLPAEKAAGNMDGWAASTGFVYEYNLNQMTDAMRSSLGPPYNTGHSNQLLQDPVVRKAMAMAVNKPEFIRQVLAGLGTVADSLCPDVNPWYYHYPTPVTFNTAQARADLNAAGWAYDVNGVYTPSATPLYKKSPSTGLGINPLQFRFYSLTTGDDWMIGSTLIKSWAAEAGVQLDLTLKTYNQLSSDWKSADYDVWLWDWMFSPTSDISTDVMSVLTTDEILGGWQDIYWSNSTYDALYNRSLLAMDPVARKMITDQLQAMAYESFSCQLVAYRKELYAASLKTWSGYGNWSQQFTLMPDQNYPYLYMQISPNGPSASPRNTAPQITSLDPYLETQKWFSQPFTGGATDSDAMEYYWYWGDGSAPTGPLGSPATTHNFTKDGYYTVWFQAKEVATTDHFGSVGKMLVKVMDNTNRAPSNLAISYTPGSPNTGNVVQFYGSATDLDSDPLYYSWDFGDGFTSLQQNPTHQYITPGSYTAKLFVTDNHVGSVARPVNTTNGGFIVVSDNAKPIISVPDFGIRVAWKVSTQYNITATDADNSLRMTWVWGDGETSVTTVPTAWHTYMHKGTFTVNVYADDLTGLSGHNATDSGTVVIYGTATPPNSLTLTANVTNPFQDELISFTGKAKDASGEDLRYTFKFGDGTYANVNTVATNQLVTVVVTHWYNTPGTKSAYLYVSDGQTNVSTAVPLVITVRALNQAPSVTPLVNVTGDSGQLISFSATAWDPDSDLMNYTWDFGDGSALAVGNPVVHAYASAGTFTFTVYVSDGQGHNSSSSAFALVAYVLSLPAGWNMISVPMSGVIYKASTLGLSTDDVVSGWNGSAYNQNFIVGRSPSRNDFNLTDSTGYWVWAGGPRVLHLLGSVPTAPQTKTITVPGAGWALIGFLGFNSTRNASNIASMFSGGSVTTVASYNTTSGLYIVYTGAPRTDFRLVSGKAYWIYCTASGTLSYTP